MTTQPSVPSVVVSGVSSHSNSIASPRSSSSPKANNILAINQLLDRGNYLLIILFQEGRRFSLPTLPYPDSRIIISVNMDGDLIETDHKTALNINGGGNFTLNQELGFKIMGKQLKALVNQNASASVQVFIANAKNPSRERLLVGSQEIFLSEARPRPPLTVSNEGNQFVTYHFQWKRLLGGHIQFSEIPKLKFTIYFEKDETTQNMNNNNNNNNSPIIKARTEDDTSLDVDANFSRSEILREDLRNRSSTKNHKMSLPPLSPELMEDCSIEKAKNDSEKRAIHGKDIEEFKLNTSYLELTPSMDVDKGLFFIGQERNARFVFNLVFHFIFARDLDLAIPSDVVIPPNSDCHFEFVLFEYPIRSSSFNNLKNPGIMAEVVTFRIASNPDTIESYLQSSAKPLVVNLKHGAMTLASIEIPLTNLSAGVGLIMRGSKSSHDEVAFFETGNIFADVRPRFGYCLEMEVGDEYKNEDNESQQQSESQILEEDSRIWRRKTEECVIELESWKLKQKEKFLEQMPQLEENLNNVLANEWKKRELDREKLFKEKLEKIKALSRELELALEKTTHGQKEIERRERALEISEKALQQKKLQENGVLKIMQAESKRKEVSFQEELQKSHAENEKLKLELKQAQNAMALKVKRLEEDLKRSDDNLKQLQKERELRTEEIISNLRSENARLVEKLSMPSTKYFEFPIPGENEKQKGAKRLKSSPNLTTNKFPYENHFEQESRAELVNYSPSSSLSSSSIRDEKKEQQLQDMIARKNALIKQAGYQQNDELIIKLEKKIQELSKDINNS